MLCEKGKQAAQDLLESKLCIMFKRIVCNVSAEDMKLGRSESSLKLSHILFK